MLSYIALALVSLVFTLVDAQFTTVGSCTVENVAAAVARLPARNNCSLAVYRVVNAGNLGLTNEEIASDLKAVCNADCGGRFAKFAATCGNEGKNLAYNYADKFR